MRYKGQGHEISVPIPFPIQEEVAKEMLSEEFSKAYKNLYGRINPDGYPEVVSWRLEARGPRPSLAVRKSAPIGSSGPARDFRQGIFAGSVMDIPVLRRGQLDPDTRVFGPALVEERETTTVIPPKAEFWEDQFGNLRIRIRD